MRKKIVAGNWKMNTTLPEGFSLTKEVIALSAGAPGDVELIVIPPFTHLSEVAKMAKGSRVKIGAQNCAMWDQGAYTGEVSAPMLRSVGAEYVILGHSERREYFGEDSQVLLRKIGLAQANALTPIFCCGEKLAERESRNHFGVVERQVSGSLFGLTAEQMLNVVVAYEPVWAIGTGKTATAEQAQEIHAFIRQILAKNFGASVADRVSILYGGSCKPSNAAEIFAKADVDGGLIGGASLVAGDFIGIAKAF